MRTEDDLTLKEALKMAEDFFNDEKTDTMSEVTIIYDCNGYYTVRRNQAIWKELVVEDD